MYQGIGNDERINHIWRFATDHGKSLLLHEKLECIVRLV